MEEGSGESRLSQVSWCRATTEFDGLICKCARQSGHRGDHRKPGGCAGATI
jgi:hypothetical protein